MSVLCLVKVVMFLGNKTGEYRCGCRRVFGVGTLVLRQEVEVYNSEILTIHLPLCHTVENSDRKKCVVLREI